MKTLLWLSVLPLLLAVCGSGYWIEDPHVMLWQDPNFDFSTCYRFTIVRYHSIDSSVEVPGQSEDAFDYDIANNLMARGYSYTSELDSADFVIAPIVTEAYYTRNRISEEIDELPNLPNVKPINIDALEFGSNEQFPVATASVGAMRTNPFFEAVVYDRHSSRPVYAYTARAVARDTDYRIPAAMMVSNFAKELPERSPTWTPGSGIVGMWFDIFTVDGENFWPRVTNVVKGSAAEDAGVQDGDMLIAVDGVETKNAPLSMDLAHLSGKASDRKQLVFWRWPGQILNVHVTMKHR